MAARVTDVNQIDARVCLWLSSRMVITLESGYLLDNLEVPGTYSAANATGAPAAGDWLVEVLAANVEGIHRIVQRAVNVATGAAYTRARSGTWTAWTYATAVYDVHFDARGTALVDGETLVVVPVTRALRIPADFAGHGAYVLTAPNSAVVVDLIRFTPPATEVVVGEISVATNGAVTVSTTDGVAQDLAVGDTLLIELTAAPDNGAMAAWFTLPLEII